MSEPPPDEEKKKDVRRMTASLTDQTTMELLTRAGMQAKHKRWDLQERKKAGEAGMADQEVDDGAEEDGSKMEDTEMSVDAETKVTDHDDPEANVKGIEADTTRDMEKGKGVVTQTLTAAKDDETRPDDQADKPMESRQSDEDALDDKV